MKRSLLGIIFCSYVLLLSTACTYQNPQSSGITNVAPQTAPAKQISEETNTTTLKPENVNRPIQAGDIDHKYFDGIIVITQYYTFLGNGLHKQAYELFSSSAKSSRSKEEFVQMAATNFKSTQIVSVLPYFLDVAKQGGRVEPDPENIARFAVSIKAWGEGNMSGSKKNGELQSLFIELARENNGWKINSFSTAPFP